MLFSFAWVLQYCLFHIMNLCFIVGHALYFSVFKNNLFTLIPFVKIMFPLSDPLLLQPACLKHIIVMVSQVCGNGIQMSCLSCLILDKFKGLPSLFLLSTGRINRICRSSQEIMGIKTLHGQRHYHWQICWPITAIESSTKGDDGNLLFFLPNFVKIHRTLLPWGIELIELYCLVGA